MLPLSVMAVSEPPGLDQAPGSSFHRSKPLPGLLCGRSGSGCAFPNFRWLRRSPFHPFGIPTVDRGSATLLSIAWSASPDRVLGVHATPFPPGGKVPPGRHQPAPGSYCSIRRLMSDLSIERRTIFLFARRLRFPSSRLSPHGAQRHVGQVIGSGSSLEPHA